MKLMLTIAAHLAIGTVLAWGILRATQGHPLLLLVGVLAYAVMFAKLGCLPGTSH